MLPGDKRKFLIWTLMAILILPPVVDFVTWSSWRQSLQRAADHAAMRGATALRDGEAPEPHALSLLPVRRLGLVAPPAIEHPPRAGNYAGRPEAVRVTLEAVRAPFFWRLLFGPVRMKAVSTAAVVPSSRSGTRPARVE